MQRFVARENVRRFKEQLKDCNDEGQRQTLSRLLAEEEAKLKKLLRDEVDWAA
jgi:hypothetical protein